MSNDDVPWFEFGLLGAGFLTGLSNGRTKRLVRKKLNALTFWQGGMRASVLRVADGNGQLSDLEEIGRLLRTTQDETGAVFEWIRKNRERIAKSLGVGVAQKIDYVSYRKMGPGKVRDQLAGMVAAKSLSPEGAKEVLAQIDAFNALLDEVN